MTISDMHLSLSNAKNFQNVTRTYERFNNEYINYVGASQDKVLDA